MTWECCAASAREQAEAVRQALENLLGTQNPCSDRRQLDR